MRLTGLLLFSVFVLCLQSVGGSLQYDSVGIEKIGDKSFILHKVEMSETLYSVSRKYNVSIYKIIESNPPTEYGLEVGQIIKIPMAPKAPESEKREQITSAQVKLKPEPDNKITSGKVALKPETGQIITHEVKPKETLFAISRQYDVTVEQLKKWNNLSSNSIDIGQMLKIKKGLSTQSLEKDLPSNNPGHETHIIQQSETLYSLSKRYNVTVENLMKWNSLTSPEISIGQELIVGLAEMSMNKDTVDVENSSTISYDSLIGVSNEINLDTISDVVESYPGRMNNPVTTSTEFEEVIESGVAALIEGSASSRKYLALHRTAKVGTIMRVHNEMNDQEVFVRVLGKLPDTGINKNVVIRISKSAYDRLGAIDPTFRVTVSYIP